MDTHVFQDNLEREFATFSQNSQRPNILLIGGTGVGKSSLINACFGEELARVGVGKPVTEHIESFSCSSIPVVLFDSKGYEIGSDKEKSFIQDVIRYANSSAASEPIHMAWYCIQASGGRIVDFDVSVINQLRQVGLPIAIVVTKADLFSELESETFRSEIDRLLPGIAVFETTTKQSLNYLQLLQLCQWSADNFPVGLRISFIAAQRRNIELKRAEAHNIVVQHSAGSAFVGFAPIPFSDAPILLANQIGMIARILYVYNLNGMRENVSKLLGGTAIGTLLSQSGIWLAGQLAKLLPVVGTLIGGAINGTVAASLTYAVGIAVSELCAQFSEAVLEGNADRLKAFVDNMPAFFSDELFKNFKF
jgi:uncharacterized protein (DUF697 family)/GTP-binding protein EngB required for normal cell division